MRLLANLDAEATWAGAPLPGKVAQRISQLAPLLAALAPPAVRAAAAGDELEIWAPAAATGMRWDAIGRHATMRVGTPPARDHASAADPQAMRPRTIAAQPWDLAWAAPAAKAANDRRVAVAVQHALGLAHAHVVTDVRALDELVSTSSEHARGDSRAARSQRLPGPWVAKAPWTAAGRDRIHGVGPLRADQRTYAERLLARQGALVVEPWLERHFDVGVCARLEGSRMTAEPPHTLVCDARGAFLGIDLAPPPLTPAQRAQLDEAVEASGRALAALGYAGPFTVDAFVHAGGLHAPCEINARYSFGHVARALGAARLGFGPPPPEAVVLVETAELTAWRA